jgi:hypothetical protein
MKKKREKCLNGRKINIRKSKPLIFIFQHRDDSKILLQKGANNDKQKFKPRCVTVGGTI